MSSDELTRILEEDGARVVAHTDHGLLFAAHRHLFLVRPAQIVAANELADVMRYASITRLRLRSLLHDLRAAIASG
jgi:hypothetical protein